MSVSGVSKLSQRNSFRACGGERETDGKCGFSLSLSPSPFLAVGLTVISYSFNLGFHFFLCCFPYLQRGLVCTQDNHYFSTSIKSTRFASHPPSLSRKTIRTTSVVGNGRAQLGGSFIAAGLPCLPPSASKLKGLCACVCI